METGEAAVKGNKFRTQGQGRGSDVNIRDIRTYGAVFGDEASKYRPVLRPWLDDPYRLREQECIKELRCFIDRTWFG